MFYGCKYVFVSSCNIHYVNPSHLLFSVQVDFVPYSLKRLTVFQCFVRMSLKLEQNKPQVLKPFPYVYVSIENSMRKHTIFNTTSRACTRASLSVRPKSLAIIQTLT